MINAHLTGEINRLREALAPTYNLQIVVERSRSVVVVARDGFYKDALIRYIPDECSDAAVTRIIDELIKEVNNVS